MLALRTDLFGIGTLVDEYLRDGLHTVVSALGQDFENSPPSAQQHQGFIHGDARQPGRESRLFFEGVEVKENFVKRLLHNIFGIFPIICYSLRHRQNSPFVTKNQLFESSCIPTLCGSHQPAVGVFIHTTRTKVFHNSVPPRHLSKRQTTLNNAIGAPKGVGGRTAGNSLKRNGDERFQRILGSEGVSASLTGCWHSVYCAGLAESTCLAMRGSCHA